MKVGSESGSFWVWVQGPFKQISNPHHSFYTMPIAYIFMLTGLKINYWTLKCESFLCDFSFHPQGDVPAAGRSWVRQAGPTELGPAHHCCHRVPHLYQVWLGYDHQTSAQAHCPLVGIIFVVNDQPLKSQFAYTLTCIHAESKFFGE